MHIDLITIAVDEMDAMVRFYNAVFDARLTPVGPPNVPDFYMGRLGAIDLLFCPNSLFEIEAEHNRQQFRFVVDDLETTLSQVEGAGGQVLTDSFCNGLLKACGVVDPEGNRMEFVEYPEVESGAA